MDEIIDLDGGRSFGLLLRAVGPPRGVAVVLLNAGLIHRAGPFRLHVQLARELSAQGFDVLRFDLPRIGDAPAGSLGSEEAAIKDAIDRLVAATGCTGILVGGLCSGADRSFALAAADRRITGLLMIDGLAVRNHWFRIGQLSLILKRSPLTWPGMVARLLRARSVGTPQLADFREWPDHETFHSQLAQMLERGVKVLALYTGGVAYYMLHARQLDATFGRSRGHAGLQGEYWPGLDHLLFAPGDRRRLVDRIKRWAVQE